MTIRLLLDTNVVSDYVAAVPTVRTRVDRTPPSQTAISVVTELEIEFGLLLAPARARALRPGIDGFLEKVTVLALSREDARATAAIRVALKKLGTPIGPYDLLLAGTALARDLTLVTANVSEFSRVEGLRVESWR